MNYKLLYDKIINRRKIEVYDGYTENHHIIPKSLGGSDLKTNLVALSAKEHYICHLLLTKIYDSGVPHHKMVCAFMMMQVSSKFHERHVSSRMYEKLRQEWAIIISDKQSGIGNSQAGTRWVSDPKTGISLKIDNTEIIPTGFVVGRNVKWKTCSICAKMHLGKTVRCRLCITKIRETIKPIIVKKEKKLRIKKICPVCSKEYETGKGRKSYCSKKCSTKYGNTAVARSVIDEFGNCFNTLTEASKHFGITVEAVRYRIKIGRYKYGG